MTSRKAVQGIASPEKIEGVIGDDIEASEADLKAAIQDAAERRLETLEKNKHIENGVEHEVKRVCFRKKKVVKDSVPATRVWKMQKPEAPFVALGLLGTLLTGALMPSFALIFAEVGCSLATQLPPGHLYSSSSLSVNR